MRLRIPQPVLAWFNAISTSTKRHHQVEKVEECTEESISSASPLIVKAIQDLCYEIFALPVCTLDAVDVAQTICGHIYDIARSSSPALQLIVLDLIPTLVHVYVVLSTILSSNFGGFSTNQRNSSSRHQKTSEVAAKPRITKSLRERLKKSSADAFRRSSLNRTVRQHTRRILSGFSTEPTNAPNSGVVATPASVPIESSIRSSSSATTANSCIATTSTLSSTTSKTASTAAHMASLAAVLEILLLGLHNIYVSWLAERWHGANIYSALSPFASGSVFCGPLSTVRKREDLEMVESLIQLSSTKDPTTLRFGGKTALEECELTAYNRWRVLCILCRLCTYRMSDLSDRGREAFCHLALLLGPRGLREHRFPPPVVTTTTDRSAVHHGNRSRWRRFTRHNKPRHSRRVSPQPPSLSQSRSSTPMRVSNRRSGNATAASTRLDIVRITAPLRSAAAMHRAKTSLLVGLHSDSTVISGSTGIPEEEVVEVKDERNCVENVSERNASQTPTITGSSVTTTSRSSSSEETGSNMSLYSDDGFAVVSEEDLAKEEDEEKEEEEEDTDDDSGGSYIPGHRSQACLSKMHQEKRDSNASNCQDAVTSGVEIDEIFTNARSTLDDGDDDDDIVTANSHSSCTHHSPESQQQQQLDKECLQQQSPVHALSEKKEKQIIDRNEAGKSNRRHFHGIRRTGGVKNKRQPEQKARHGKPWPAEMPVAAARIPRPPAYFVLDLLPGLHFALTTAQSHLAAAAIEALARRADSELWSNVLIYANSIRNSKVYIAATSASSTETDAKVKPSKDVVEQSNQSNVSTFLRPLSSVNSSTSSCSAAGVASAVTTGSGASSTPEEEHFSNTSATVIETCRLCKAPTPITNASFQAVRPEEDIPLVFKYDAIDRGVDNLTSVSTSPFTTTPATEFRPWAKSLSPRREAASLPSPPSRGSLRLNCATCSNKRTSARQRTLSFNNKLCGALRSGRPKSPYNLKVTFAADSATDHYGVPPLLLPPPQSDAPPASSA